MQKLILFLFIMSLSFWVLAQDISENLQAKIDSIVQPYIAEYSIAGMSIGVVANGQDYVFNYGTTEQGGGYPVGDSTMFHTASITKLFTATAIMQLVEQDKLSLDDKLVDIIPEFCLKSKAYNEITIRHLLTHSSGLPWNHNMKTLPNDSSAIPLLLHQLKKTKLNFLPGSKFSGETYSNVAFDLLGIVIEKRSKQTYHNYVTQQVLSKVGINEATYFYETVARSNLAVPQVVAGDSKKIQRFNLYRIDDKKNPILNGTPLTLRNYEVYGEPYIDNPAGNLITNSCGLNKWARYMIDLKNEAIPEGEGVISKSSLEEMWSIEKKIAGHEVSIGLAWWIFDNSDLGRYFCHFGNNPGFCASFYLFPNSDFSVHILTNGMFAQEAVFNGIPLEIAALLIEK